MNSNFYECINIIMSYNTLQDFTRIFYEELIWIDTQIAWCYITLLQGIISFQAKKTYHD